MSEHNQYPRYEDLRAENAALRDLIAAAITALDVPAPADLTETGTEVHLRALRERAGSARIALNAITTPGGNPANRAAWLREQVAESPITYTPFRHAPLPELAPDAELAPEPVQADGAAAPTAADLVERATQLRDQLANADLPQAAMWEVTQPTSDLLAAYADRPENLVMLSGHLATEAAVTAWATAWSTAVTPDPAPRYVSARTTITGITVEVWARTTGGAR